MDMTANWAILLRRVLVDPLFFVQVAFCWGEGDLVDQTGSDEWQVNILSHVRDNISHEKPLQIAVASGHGVGKSALVAWLLLWSMIRADTRGIVTANTATQLQTKTWPELGVWLQRLRKPFSDLFRKTATTVTSADDSHRSTWRLDAVPWSENRTESFAGLHNKGKRIIVVFDEASAIPDIIWETTEGALTDSDTEIIWLVCGNPTRNSGRFRECFGKYRHRWHTVQVDSRTAKMTNKTLLNEWVKDYGEDSDFCRVRIRGVFPRAGSTQFIPSDIVDHAVARAPAKTVFDPLVMGVDVARFGGDSSVICFRRGRDAKEIPWERYRGMDTMELAARVATNIERYKPDAVFVDGDGVGGGVVDRLRQLGHQVIEVHGAVRPDGPVEGETVSNKRAEVWAKAKYWLKTGGSIPNDLDLIADLTGVEYGYNAHNEIQLEKKEDMKKRGLASPDLGDALAYTFAYPVAEKDRRVRGAKQAFALSNYDPFAALYSASSEYR